MQVLLNDQLAAFLPTKKVKRLPIDHIAKTICRCICSLFLCTLFNAHYLFLNLVSAGT